MANLRDIKTRIGSVKTTRQVTSAMKMVSAARLKKAQDNISHIRPYTSRLAGIIQDLTSTQEQTLCGDCSVPKDSEGPVLVVAIASNRGLCGGFNVNVVKEVQSLLDTTLRDDFRQGKVLIGVMGKQAEKMFKSRNLPVDFVYHDMLIAPTYSSISDFANQLMADFRKGELKRVVLVYNEFVNAAVQEVQTHQFLPFSIPEQPKGAELMDYLIEPDPATIIQQLVPKMLQTMMYQVVLESAASEHGARMTSMHKATDNATDLIRDLELSYNKARQTAITNQIVEITGGAEALSKG
ncbi:ATP synthase F1 subunit gamma [Geofilum rubicundum]|uniref:ATP synthase gamma chain n=1 Tax=Geofilum rubicundum JCM 15548 TaxID=1236989 RepID=A0A0E9LSM5_9BACT|nr:ATP synthase F1 subunit gamma [Geofilum rubicundum]GAO28293.1 ATP synthase gamma chain [Geofilum rubicundum JCM 15548]